MHEEDEKSDADVFQLTRFVEAQRPVYPQVRRELEAGQKRSHWMWFVFPQVRGLGSSSMAQRYAIGDLAEAQAYLGHPVLGPRLRECVGLVNEAIGRSLEEIFGYPDDLKFCSSVTLFQQAAQQMDDLATERLMSDALRRFCGSKPDAGTLRMLGAAHPAG